MEKRHGGLRVIGTIFKVLGIIAGILAILMALGICISAAAGGAFLDSLSSDFGSDTGMIGSVGGLAWGLMAGLFSFIYGSIGAMSLYAFGGGIHLLIDMEENTRMTATLLQTQRAQQEAGSAQR